MKKYSLGLDNSSIGYFVLLEGNKIISTCQVPQKINMYQDNIKGLNKLILELKPELDVKGKKTKTKELIAISKQRIAWYEDNSVKDTTRTLKWLKEYANFINICNIEKQIFQTANPTTIKSLTKMAESLGIATTLLEICNIRYNIISIQEWRKYYNYKDTPSNLTYQKRREFVKSESIRIAREQISNIDDFWYIGKSKKENSDIAESSLLAYIGDT